jgi:hypothetical protein
MSGIESKTFDKPDESRQPDKTRVDVVKLGDAEAARITFQPGWRWSDCIRPVVGTDSCQAEHIGYLEAGTMTVAHDDGTEETLHAGNVYRITPGHDAWVVGDEAVVGYEFKSAATYAKA